MALGTLRKFKSFSAFSFLGPCANYWPEFATIRTAEEDSRVPIVVSRMVLPRGNFHFASWGYGFALAKPPSGWRMIEAVPLELDRIEKRCNAHAVAPEHAETPTKFVMR